jgi:hypothetical protein
MWVRHIGRKPCAGRYVVVPRDMTCEDACNFLREDPKMKGVIGIDCEFFSADDGYKVRRMTKWSNWPKELKSLYPINTHGNVEKHGPFVRLIQLTRVDGSAVVIDLFELKEIPTELLTFLLDKNIYFVGHDFKNDLHALRNTDIRLGGINISADPFTIWNAFRMPNVIAKLRETYYRQACDLPMSPVAFSKQDKSEIPINALIGVPFEFHLRSPKLTNLAECLIGLEIPKAKQGRGMDWAGTIDFEQFNYAALDPIVTLDVYLILDQFFDELEVVKNTLGQGKGLPKICMLDSSVWPKLVSCKDFSNDVSLKVIIHNDQYIETESTEENVGDDPADESLEELVFETVDEIREDEDIGQSMRIQVEQVNWIPTVEQDTNQGATRKQISAPMHEEEEKLETLAEKSVAALWQSVRDNSYAFRLRFRRGPTRNYRKWDFVRQSFCDSRIGKMRRNFSGLVPDQELEKACKIFECRLKERTTQVHLPPKPGTNRYKWCEQHLKTAGMVRQNSNNVFIRNKLHGDQRVQYRQAITTNQFPKNHTGPPGVNYNRLHSNVSTYRLNNHRSNNYHSSHNRLNRNDSFPPQFQPKATFQNNPNQRYSSSSHQYQVYSKGNFTQQQTSSFSTPIRQQWYNRPTIFENRTL